jgi:CRP/FNR family transcriptional regulator, cyclic AMP receptor protein
MAARGVDAAGDESETERAVGRDALRACRLFSGVEDATVDRCAAAMRVRHFRRGEVIFHIDDPGDSLFVVTHGSVKIVVPPHDGTDPAILTTIGPGGFFGELALFDGAPRSASAIALGAVSTQVLRRDAFQALLDEEPEMRRALLVTLAREIRRLTAQVEDLHFLDLPGRLAQHLLRQVGDGDALPEGEQRVPWPYTQAELAGMIGGARQSVNRLLADFVDQGLLRFEGDDLVIPDPGRLAAAARR